jgi:hypothetical protein
MGRLDGSRCYQIGPIDNCPNGGVDWRRSIRPALEKMGVGVLDPTNKPIKDYNEDAELIASRRALKEAGKFDELAAIMKPIRNVDLRMCDIVDFGIAFLDTSIVMCGTWEEIVTLNREKKPVLIVCKQGKKAMPDWTFAQLPHEFFFNNFDELLVYLNKVNNNECETSERWVFFDFSRF